MKKNKQNRDAPEEAAAASILSSRPGRAADKAGWLRRFCGRGMFREIWKNRYVILNDQQLTICEKEGHAGVDEVLDLSHFGSCDDVKNRKKKMRSKKNHSKFSLQRCAHAHSTAASILFLAVSPEDKESWIHVLNVAITRAKNKVLDQVTADQAQLCHMTRDRARICRGRRPPSRGHLLAVASSSDGTVTLDLIREDVTVLREFHGRNPEETLTSPASGRVRSEPDGALFTGSEEAFGKTRSLPCGGAAALRQTGSARTYRSREEPRTSRKNRRASVDEIRGHSDKNRTAPPRRDASASVDKLHHLICLKVAQTERLLAAATRDRPEGRDGKRTRSVEEMRAEAFGLLKEALDALEQARRILQEVKELGKLHHQPNGCGGPRLAPAPLAT
ncbi:pleckstrin homology domain-containing family O member 1b isoform X2 [Syngnathoides biaculeatus]|uniref:pleckstrin homology domain-containing family O member 1b isoform X2 n=1 Tax=Syngnathoides biaculeatus TaxID=300417 RepID=UPI002ADE3124|nr:pleckstrin homology domain-containing family O member 1b isoform X2 [Syngnathoides biaculeatus]